MMKKTWLGMLLTLLFISGCGTSQGELGGNTGDSANEKVEFPQLTTEVAEGERLVEMETSKGKITIKLFPEQAPKTVENFIKHSEEGYYNGVTFHRVMNDFMIQGGDPEGTGRGGESIYGKPFEDEFSSALYNFRGALSMANSGPDTNGSQFFIVQNKNLDPSLTDKMKKAGYHEDVLKHYEQGGTPWLDGKHTVFGQVVKGMEVVDEIAAVEVGAADKPIEDVVISKITVLK